jgi:hypothetical protein
MKTTVISRPGSVYVLSTAPVQSSKPSSLSWSALGAEFLVGLAKRLSSEYDRALWSSPAARIGLVAPEHMHLAASVRQRDGCDPI